MPTGRSVSRVADRRKILKGNRLNRMNRSIGLVDDTFTTTTSFSSCY